MRKGNVERREELTSALDVPNNRPRRIIPFLAISKKTSLGFSIPEFWFQKENNAHMNSTRTCVTPPREPVRCHFACVSYLFLSLWPCVKRERGGEGGSITSTAEHSCNLDELDGDFSRIHGRCGSSLFYFSDLFEVNGEACDVRVR